MNPFDRELKLSNTKPMMNSKLKELLSEIKKFKVQAILVLEYKKRNDCKIFHLSAVIVRLINIANNKANNIAFTLKIRFFYIKLL